MNNTKNHKEVLVNDKEKKVININPKRATETCPACGKKESVIFTDAIPTAECIECGANWETADDYLADLPGGKNTVEDILAKQEAPMFSTHRTWESYQDDAKRGNLPDASNPIFIFSGIKTHLLLAIISGDINAVALARKELASRGLDINGAWVGFDRAEELRKSDKS